MIRVVRCMTWGRRKAPEPRRWRGRPRPPPQANPPMGLRPQQRLMSRLANDISLSEPAPFVTCLGGVEGPPREVPGPTQTATGRLPYPRGTRLADCTSPSLPLGKPIAALKTSRGLARAPQVGLPLGFGVQPPSPRLLHLIGGVDLAFLLSVCTTNFKGSAQAPGRTRRTSGRVQSRFWPTSRR